MLIKKSTKYYRIILLFVVVIAILIAVALSHRAPERHKPAELSKFSDGSQSKSVAESIRRYSATAESLKRIEEAASASDGKIEFYGKVIDHRGDPVAGATVEFMVLTSMHIVSNRHNSIAEVLTDKLGRFEVVGKRGSSMSVQRVKKDGYRFLTGGKTFSYDFSKGPKRHLSDRMQPVELTMVPSEFNFTSIVRPQHVGSRFNWNSGPIEVPIGKTGEVLILRPTRDMELGERKGFAWSVEVQIKNGSLMRRNKGDNLLLAPMMGYNESVVVGHKRGAVDWGGGLRGANFVFKTSAGKYGRFALDIYPDVTDGQVGAGVKFHFNPTGERYLD